MFLFGSGCSAPEVGPWPAPYPGLLIWAYLLGAALGASGAVTLAVATHSVLSSFGLGPPAARWLVLAPMVFWVSAMLTSRVPAGGGSRLRRGALVAAGLTAVAAPVLARDGGVGLLAVLTAAWAVLVSLALVVRPRGVLERMGAAQGSRHCTAAMLIAGFAVLSLLPMLMVGDPFGHDESAYALRARSWLWGTPDTGWGLHRAPGLPVLGTLVLPFTEQEWGFRLLAALFALLAVVGVFWLGSRLGGRSVGLISVAVMIGGVAFLRRAPEYLTDIPSAALLLMVAALLWHQLEQREAPGWMLVWAGVLGAAAFYLRYQSVLALTGMALGALVAWPRKVRLAWRPFAAAAGAFVLLVVPHFVVAIEETGSPLGLMLFASRAGGRDYLGQGLVDYVRLFPVQLAGPVGALALAIALVGGTVLVVRRRGRRGSTERFAAFALVVALAVVVPMGIVSHGEPRFVFLPLFLLLILGVQLGVRFWRPRLGPGRTAVYLATLAMLISIALLTSAHAVERRRSLEEAGQVLLGANQAIGARAGSYSCGVITSRQPQVTWYSGCFTANYGHPARIGREDLLEGDERFLLLFDGDPDDPTGEILDYYLDRATGPVATIDDLSANDADATVYSLVP